MIFTYIIWFFYFKTNTLGGVGVDKIKLEHIYLEYNDDNQKYSAIEDLNFTVKEGEFVSIIGSSGCGKSTTLSILSGLRSPTKGVLYIDGKESVGTSKNRSVVFQHYSLFPWMTSRKNVCFGIKQVSDRKNKKEINSLAEKYLKAVGLESFEDKYPYQLSGGMQQRVAIARTLAMQPEILLMDEPFGAIDAKNRVALQDLLLELLQNEEEKKTIVLVTHDIDEAILLSDRILFMSGKTIEEEIKVNFERPRKRDDLYGTDHYKKLRQKIMNLFYKNVGERIGNEEVVL